jgi:hypothetical protein
MTSVLALELNNTPTLRDQLAAAIAAHKAAVERQAEAQQQLERAAEFVKSTKSVVETFDVLDDQIAKEQAAALTRAPNGAMPSFDLSPELRASISARDMAMDQLAAASNAAARLAADHAEAANDAVRARQALDAAAQHVLEAEVSALARAVIDADAVALRLRARLHGCANVWTSAGRLALSPDARKAINLRGHADLIGTLNEPPMLAARAAHSVWINLFDRLHEDAEAKAKF